MRPEGPIARLEAISRSYGKDAARQKLELLDEIERLEKLSAGDLLRLQDSLSFLRAYPDNAELLKRVDQSVARLRQSVAKQLAKAGPRALLNSGLPGSTCSYPYSYGVFRRMVSYWPRSVDVDWEEFDAETELLDGLGLLVTRGEYQGLEDIRISMQDWVARSKTDLKASDIQFILELLERSQLSAQVREYIVDHLDLPIRFELTEPGTGKCEAQLPVERRVFQRREIERERFPLAPRIGKTLACPSPLIHFRGDQALRVALAALGCRQLEIYPLIHANPKDVRLISCERGLTIVLAGVLPEFRSALESLYFVMILKNGVPVAYGPAAIFLGACELGINLFPEFRGGEIRLIYSQFMRVLHQLLGVESFFLTPYGMGEQNEEAIRSGAFWFYRKLGFRATNPEVEELAREEEARMRAQPDYRSGTRTLRRLSHTEAVFDLTETPREPFDLGPLGIALSRTIARHYAGDRERAVEESVRRIRASLGLTSLFHWSDDEVRSLRHLAPVLGMLDDFASWSGAERLKLVRFIRTKGAASELEANRLLLDHPRLEACLRRLLERAG